MIRKRININLGGLGKESILTLVD